MQFVRISRVAAICVAVAMTNGCRTHETSAPQSLRDVNLTGTWVADTKVDHYKKSTGEYLYSSYQHYSYVITDAEDGTRMSECEWHSDNDRFVVKTDEHLYLNVNDTGYALINGTTLARSGSSDWDLEDDVIETWTETLTRYQKSTVPREGHITLSNPLNRDLSENVCAFEAWDDLSEYIGRNLTITNGDERLTLSVAVKKGTEVGNYDYYRDSPWDEPIRQFWLDIRQGDEYPIDDSDGDGTLVIETLDNNIFVMGFNLVGDNARFEGTLEFTPPWELKR